MPAKTNRVFLPCSGLGRIQRGYESFAQECFDALSGRADLDVRLFKGGGSGGEKETVLRNWPRRSLAAIWMGRMLRRDAYFVEQLTFFFSLRRYIIAQRPRIVYFSDGNLGNLLWRWRKRHALQYRLLFCNGGPLSPPFPRWDMVQQVASTYFEEAKKEGQPDERQIFLPYGFVIPAKVSELDQAGKADLRRRLGLPLNRTVLLSVGAINRTHKRMDYLVVDLAALPEPRPFLQILGQEDGETMAIRELAEARLGAGNYRMLSVRVDQMANYYQASDGFVLASLREGFGRVYVEAMAHGLPCMAHDYMVSREVLGPLGYYADFSQHGSLTKMLREVLSHQPTKIERSARHARVYENFGWARLGERYAHMLGQCAEMTTRTAP
jgi:glycosyltransferase involved in cell wall biosynthesis